MLGEHLVKKRTSWKNCLLQEVGIFQAVSEQPVFVLDNFLGLLKVLFTISESLFSPGQFSQVTSDIPDNEGSKNNPENQGKGAGQKAQTCGSISGLLHLLFHLGLEQLIGLKDLFSVLHQQVFGVFLLFCGFHKVIED